MVAIEGDDISYVRLGGVRVVIVGFRGVGMGVVVAAVVFAVEASGDGGRKGGFAGAWNAGDGDQEAA